MNEDNLTHDNNTHDNNNINNNNINNVEISLLRTKILEITNERNKLKLENANLRHKILSLTNEVKTTGERNFKPSTSQLDNILSNVNNNNNDDEFVIVDLDINDGTNDWTKQNYETVKGWQDDIEKSSLVHNEILNSFFNSLQNVLIACLALGVVITIFSALSVTLGFLDVKWVPIAFNIAVLLCGASITLMTGFVKIRNWENLILMLARLVEKLDNTWFVLRTELSIEPSQRLNAKDFIKRYDGEYAFLMRQNLPIMANVYSAATIKSKERLYKDHLNDLKIQNKFKEDLNEMIEVIV